MGSTLMAPPMSTDGAQVLDDGSPVGAQWEAIALIGDGTALLPTPLPFRTPLRRRLTDEVESICEAFGAVVGTDGAPESRAMAARLAVGARSAACPHGNLRAATALVLHAPNSALDALGRWPKHGIRAQLAIPALLAAQAGFAWPAALRFRLGWQPRWPAYCSGRTLFACALHLFDFGSFSNWLAPSFSSCLKRVARTISAFRLTMIDAVCPSGYCTFHAGGVALTRTLEVCNMSPPLLPLECFGGCQVMRPRSHGTRAS